MAEQTVSAGKWLRAWIEGGLARAQLKDYGPLLNDLAIPILILHGDKDMRFPVGVARRLSDEVDNATLKIIHGVGHLAFVEAKATWCALVKTFICEAGRKCE
jgi:pimeloyl-ACP methyl ester carboxylesterase